MGVAPVFAGAEFLVAAVIAPDSASRFVIGRHETVLVAHAAIVRGFHLVPDDVAVFGQASLVQSAPPRPSRTPSADAATPESIPLCIRNGCGTRRYAVV